MRKGSFAPWEDEILRRNYHNTTNAILAKALGRTDGSIAARAYKLHLLKDKEFILECSRHTQFKKGQVPANKGKKMPYNANVARTQFKKGIIPPNTVPVGTEVIDKEGYLKRKVSDRKDVPSRRNWKYVHRMVWEEHNGPVPKGSVVVFKNGDRTDIRLDNLECITMAENAKRNQVKYPPEFKRLSQMIGALNRQINKREKNG